jgi:hypothetical protein
MPQENHNQTKPMTWLNVQGALLSCANAADNRRIFSSKWTTNTADNPQQPMSSFDAKHDRLKRQERSHVGACGRALVLHVTRMFRLSLHPLDLTWTAKIRHTVLSTLMGAAVWRRNYHGMAGCLPLICIRQGHRPPTEARNCLWSLCLAFS